VFLMLAGVRQGGRVIARRRQRAHQAGGVTGAERVEAGEPTPGGDGFVGASGVVRGRSQVLERAERRAPESRSLLVNPPFEVGNARKVEALEKLTAVERGGS
jgi:hypothetical protein